MFLYVDIETYSSVDLKKFGAYAYAESPDFEILMCAYAFGDDPVRVLVGEQAIADRLGKALVDKRIQKVAHNANFERVCFTRMLDAKRLDYHGYTLYLDATQWVDTAALACEWGYPAKLEMLAPRLGVDEKDSAGTRLISMFCKPYRGTRRRPADKPQEWEEFLRYCAQDVEVLRQVHRALPDWPTKHERLVWLADSVVNDRGIRVDLDMAAAAVAANEDNVRHYTEDLRNLLQDNNFNPNSTQQYLKALEANGIQLPDMKSATIEAALADPRLTPEQRYLLLARQATSLAAVRKYTSALGGACADGRVRGGFRFFGAHTGRWAGRGVQPQNMPRGDLSDTQVRAALLDLQLGLGADPETLKGLVRSMFQGPFTVVDYSSIEARVLAWLAGEQWALDAFKADRDIYVETAYRMGLFGEHTPDSAPPKAFKEARFKGKVAVLALGYQGAVQALRNMGYDRPDSEALELVAQWRAANAKIVGFWADLNAAFWRGGEVGHLRVERAGQRQRRIWLPSGRPLCYHDVRKDMNSGRVAFRDNRGVWVDLYGGRLAENVTQAVARDLLAAALVTLEENGQHTVGHVHDEVITEGVVPVKTVATLMCSAPLWAKGLPVTGEGFQCERYKKG